MFLDDSGCGSVSRPYDCRCSPGGALHSLRLLRYGRAFLENLSCIAVCTSCPRDWVHLVPWLTWALYLRIRLWPDGTPWMTAVPLGGLIKRLLHPAQFEITGRWLAIA